MAGEVRAQALAQAERQRLIPLPAPAVVEPCPPLRLRRAFEV